MAASVLTRAAIETPIIFVHGNGDTAALWLTTIWRFESNGYPRDRLFAIDFDFPQARADDAVPMAGRSGSADQLRALAALIDEVRATTGADKVALVASSRGANAVRNYVRFGRGEETVSHAVLCGGVNHGAYASATFNPGSEFNGTGPFMLALNAPYSDGNEVSPRVEWLTLRSDHFDKYAQPDGRFVGQPGMATGIAADGPALRGARNIVLPRADHREVAFGFPAFAEMFRFITGAAPARNDIAREEEVVLNGKLSGFFDGAPTNVPLAGAAVTVHRVTGASGERIGVAAPRQAIGADGLWGPLVTHPDAALEFVIEANGYPVTHVYRSPFPRSSCVVHLRPQPPGSLGPDDIAAGSVVMISRPRGYFGAGRDTIQIDGTIPEGIPAGVPEVSVARMHFPSPPLRPVVTRFNDEAIAAINWPASGNRIAVVEFHY